MISREKEGGLERGITVRREGTSYKGKKMRETYSDSVTVSIGLDMKGVLRTTFRVTLERKRG